ncbi:MAG: hypothetical protein AAGJ97_00985 [Planctomycetota bacterium]
MSDYLLKPPGKRCVTSGRALRPGRECRSALVERDGEPVRLDYDLDAWPGPPEGDLIGHWLCRIPGQAPAVSTRPAPAERHRRFVAWDEAGTAEHEKLRYWLVVELLRSRRLELEGTEDLGYGDGPTRTLLLADPDSGDRFRVPDFGMTAGELRAYRAVAVRELPDAADEPTEEAA